jgi:hypothetical protein
MPIIACPGCNERVRIPDQYIGKLVRCPLCKHQFRVEQEEPIVEIDDEAEALRRASGKPMPGEMEEGYEEEPGEEDSAGVARRRARGGTGELSNDYVIVPSEWFHYAGIHYGRFLGPAIGYIIIVIGLSIGIEIANENMRIVAGRGLGLLMNLLVNLFLFAPLGAGFHAVALAQLKGQPWTFGDFFGGFKRYGAVVGSAFILWAALVAIGLVLGAIVGLSVAVQGPGNAPAALGILVLIIAISLPVILYVTIRIGFFTVPLIFDRGLGAMEAVQANWAMTEGHVLGLVGMSLLLGLIALGGVLLCGVGVLFAIPYIILAQDAGYLLAAGTRPPKES